MKTFKVWLKGGIEPVIVRARTAVVLDDRTLVFYTWFLNECAAFQPGIWEWYQLTDV